MPPVGQVFFRVILSSFLVLLLTACAGVPQKSRDYSSGYRQVGLASWYGPGFHGRKTSSGEVFDMHDLTAAHRTIPFGTTLRVKNLENGQWVQVRVNDRGPFIKGRILDLSYGAAKSLDMVGTGTAQVEIRVIGREEPYAKRSREKEQAGYSVQVGAFAQEENALRLKQSLERSYHPVYIVIAETREQRFYRVRVGKLPTEDQADRLALKLNTRENLETFVVRED